jgi:hypothetical protein
MSDGDVAESEAAGSRSADAAPIQYEKLANNILRENVP